MRRAAIGLWAGGLALCAAAHGLALRWMDTASVMERLLAPRADPELLVLAGGFVLSRVALIVLAPGLVAGGLCWWLWPVLAPRGRGQPAPPGAE